MSVESYHYGGIKKKMNVPGWHVGVAVDQIDELDIRVMLHAANILLHGHHTRLVKEAEPGSRQNVERVPETEQRAQGKVGPPP